MRALETPGGLSSAGLQPPRAPAALRSAFPAPRAPGRLFQLRTGDSLHLFASSAFLSSTFSHSQRTDAARLFTPEYALLRSSGDGLAPALASACAVRARDRLLSRVLAPAPSAACGRSLGCSSSGGRIGSHAGCSSPSFPVCSPAPSFSGLAALAPAPGATSANKAPVASVPCFPASGADVAAGFPCARCTSVPSPLGRSQRLSEPALTVREGRSLLPASRSRLHCSVASLPRLPPAPWLRRLLPPPLCPVRAGDDGPPSSLRLTPPT